MSSDVCSVKEKPAYTVREVSMLTGWSPQTVARVFEAEKGVIILSRPETTHKRKYRTITIPRAVYQRVIGKVTV